MKNDIRLQDLEKELKLNFMNKELLKTATTHSSYANQKKKIEFNERLEFLGDSVLQLIISEYLYLRFTQKPEGFLTKIRSLIVNPPRYPPHTCAKQGFSTCRYFELLDIIKKDYEKGIKGVSWVYQRWVKG